MYTPCNENKKPTTVNQLEERVVELERLASIFVPNKFVTGTCWINDRYYVSGIEVGKIVSGAWVAATFNLGKVKRERWVYMGFFKRFFAKKWVENQFRKYREASDYFGCLEKGASHE